jgi:atypical dual specificity phosphatase
MNFSRILRDLYVGSHPENRRDIERLKQGCRITAVLNLQTDQDLEERDLDWPALESSYRSLGIEPQRCPMMDFDYDDQRRTLPQAVQALAGLLASGHTVYLHCNEGVGRSPLVAMAYLYWCGNASRDEAVGHVKARRSCSPMTELLEAARQEILQDEDIRRRVALRAYALSKLRGNRSADPFRDWVEAEREILQEGLRQDHRDSEP